jgi:hypothetical protein
MLLFSIPVLTLTEMDRSPPCNEGVVSHKVSGANVRKKRQTDGLDQGCKHRRQNERCDSLKNQPAYTQRGRNVLNTVCHDCCDRYHAV